MMIFKILKSRSTFNEMIFKILKSRSTFNEPRLRSRCQDEDGPNEGQLVLKISNRIVEKDSYNDDVRIWICILTPTGQVGWIVEEYQDPHGYFRSERFVAEL